KVSFDVSCSGLLLFRWGALEPSLLPRPPKRQNFCPPQIARFFLRHQANPNEVWGSPDIMIESSHSRPFSNPHAQMHIALSCLFVQQTDRFRNNPYRTTALITCFEVITDPLF
ncbi:hypothetical protein RB213_003407, partial [Colletotrichum asianum]